MEKDIVCYLECPWFGGCLTITILTYFCIVPPIQNGMSMKKKSTLVYPNIPAAIWPVPYGSGLPVPESPDNFAMYSDNEDSVSSNNEEEQPSASTDADYLPSTDSSTHKITEGQKASSVTSSGISNFQKIRQNFWQQGYNSGIYYTIRGSGNISHQKPRI